MPTLASLVLATTEASEVAVWEARFAGADGLELAASGIADGLATDAVPLPPDGAAPVGRVLFGVLDLEAATFAEPGMRERLERLSWELRWKRRWRDIFKTTERSIPVPQWDAKQDATLVLPSGDAVIHAAPHLTAQGDKIGLYMSPTIAENLPTTLASAPFCTVVGWPDGVVPGGRNPQAFTVLWSEKPVPKNPAEIPSSASKLAAKWALARSLNDGFDAAKLPRPEVAAAQCMTRPGGPGSIWKVSLRLFGGVTLDAVKRALPKMRVALESPSWFIVSPSDVGCDVFVGAHPKTEGLRFVSRSAQQSCTVADLEDAFTAAKLDSPFDGSSPTLLRVEQLESNDAVTRMEFQIPAQMGLAAFQEPKAVDKLRTATGNAFLEVHPGSLPSEFVVLASETDPMPSPAPFRWEEAGADYRRVPFATRVDGRSCVWDLDLDSHLLVLGQNGSGKGIAMTAIAAPMIMNDWDLYAGDPIKGFNDFAPLDPWLRARATTYEQTAALLKHFVLLIEERKDLNAAHGVSNIRDLPAVARPRMAVLFLDELTSLVIPEAARKPPEGADAIALREYAEACRINECKALIAAGLGRIVREGRATGAVVVAAGQKLTADLLERIPGGKTIKSQFSRLAMGKMSFGDLTSAFSDPQAAMGLLGQTVPRGRGIFESTAEAPFAVQTWWGGGSQTDHFRDIVNRVSAVRAPLADDERLDLSDAERSADESVVPVFGQRLDDASEAPSPVAEPVVDLGDLGTLGLDFGAEQEPAPIAAPLEASMDVSEHEPAAASGGDGESVPSALVAASSSAALAAEGLDGVLMSVEGARVDVATVAAGADVVAELAAFLRARPRTERAVVVHCRISADWLPGVPTSVLLNDAGARAGVPVICAEPSAAVPELVSGLHPDPADSPPAPMPIAPAPLAPGAVPMPLPAPAPLELFAPPATPQIVIDPRVRFD